MSEFSINAKNLSVSYGSNKILENLSFNIRNGEFVAIVGKSGTGKTTLLNTLAGFIKHEGVINVEGSLGFCFQNHSLFYWMSVAENIAFGLNDMATNEKEERVNDILKKIDLIQLGNKLPSELSGGQMQRVALGRAIAYDPNVLFLDEPFSSLDIYTRDQMMDWVLKIISELKITILMVTHYLDEAFVLADRILVLNEKNIAHEVCVKFKKPRTQAIRFTVEFQKAKQDLAIHINN